MTREDFDHEARVLLKPESGNRTCNVSMCAQHAVLYQFCSENIASSVTLLLNLI